MKKTLCFLSAFFGMQAMAVDFTFGEYSIWCDNMRYASQGAKTDLVIFQPEGSDFEKVTSAYGTHSTRSDGYWRIEFDLKVTSPEKNVGTPLLYMELTEKTKSGGNGSGDGVIETGWILWDQEWSGTGFLRTAGKGLIRVDCTRGKKSAPRED
jgi:hypothetical protein